MIAGRNSEHYSPITWVGQMPIYATTLLVIAHIVTMIGTAVAMSVAGGISPLTNPWLEPLTFWAPSVTQHFAVWQFGTYAFVNVPTIWFAIEMLLLYSFGREIERFLGRKSFLLLYSALVLVGPLALTLLNFAGVESSPLMGGGAVHFAVFIAFVMIYPSAEVFFFRIQIKWIAAVLLAIYSLSYLAVRDWTNLGVTWLECACAVAMMRRAGISSAQFESWLPASRDDDREERPRLRGRAEKEKAPEPDLHETIDPLLEKISRHGIGSLTKRERQRLEAARTALLEQEKQTHR